VWDKLVAVLGNKEFKQVTRADGNQFVSNGIAEG
jgi:hypothetical protein